jgi:hypothetical protein
MAATVTLTTTTLSTQVGASDASVFVASTSGMTPGVRLFVDGELLSMLRFGVGTREVVVLRGVDGTSTQAHAPGSEVTIGRGDQFYMADPVGRPPNPVDIAPWINLVNGRRWVAQGDEAGPGAQLRSWALETDAAAIGSLGIRGAIVTTP